jgi:hypothetical protein
MRLSAATELMSGLGFPASTATPTLQRARTRRLPARIYRSRARDSEIRRLAPLDAGEHDLGRVVADRNLAVVRALELRDELAHHGADAVGGEDFDSA